MPESDGLLTPLDAGPLAEKVGCIDAEPIGYFGAELDGDWKETVPKLDGYVKLVLGDEKSTVPELDGYRFRLDNELDEADGNGAVPEPKGYVCPVLEAEIVPREEALLVDAIGADSG